MGDPGPNLMDGFALPPSQNDNIIPPPIAIVGIGLRLPGGIHSTEALWDLLINKRTTRGVVPSSRYNIESFWSSTKKAGFVNSQHGHFLAEEDNFEHFDASLFSLSKSEVEQLDPQQRMLLEVIWECMQNGGQKDWRGKDIGVYVGTWSDDWLDLSAKDTQEARGHGVTGCGDFAISNRVSYEYNLHGPSMTLKTACSSSLIGLNEACHALASGDCSGAIVAGSNVILGPSMSIAQTQVGVLSPTGECRTFDATANGYSRGEAINAIYIKKFDDAIRDGDPIRAVGQGHVSYPGGNEATFPASDDLLLLERGYVIRATTSNCDGKTAGFTLPNPLAHEKMIRQAYKKAKINDISETAFVECHGTGTPTGDPLELEAIAKVFGSEKGVYIGSIKPNIGHSEGASGISSVVKAVLTLENRVIPPNTNFKTPNPKIPFEEANLRVPLEPTHWPEGQVERVSVNSFGVTGSNAHAIIDSAASFIPNNKTIPLTNGDTRHRPHLLVLSASSSESLKRGVEATQDYATRTTSNFEDLVYTLGVRRDHLAYRAFAVTDGNSTFETSNSGKPKKTPQLTFVFTGQGAQWGGMGKELMSDFPSFRSDIRLLNDALRKLPDPPPWSIEEELLKIGSESRLDEAQFSQPLCTAIQVCIVNLLRSLNIFPSAVVGHSSGEIAGAYAANAINMEEAIIIAYYRGLATSSCSRRGGMAAVGMGRAEVGLYLRRGVVVACENSPLSVTLSGDIEPLEAVLQELKEDEPEVFARQLKTGGMAYHSDHMRDIGESYENMLKPLIAASSPTVPFFSSVTGQALTETEDLGSSYWKRNLESPVLFYPAVKASLENESPNITFVEIGPHSALAGPLRQIFKLVSGKRDLGYVSALIRGNDCSESVLRMAGQLYLQTVPIRFEALTPTGRVLTDLPRYQWRHETSFWHESRVTKEWRFRKFPRHEILGARILEGNELEPTWRNVLRLDDVAWLRDHSLHSDIVFPCAGYVGIAGEAIRQLSGINDFTMQRVEIKRALILQDSENIEMMTTFRPVRLTDTLDSDWYTFTISSYRGGNWEKHCVGKVKAGKDMSFAAPDTTALPRMVQSPYAAMKKVGLNYGPNFQALAELTTLPGQNLAVATVLPPIMTDSYAVHPTTMDQCLQLFAIASSNGLTRQLSKLYVPIEIDRLYINGTNGDGDMRANAQVSTKSSSSIIGDGALGVGDEVILCLQGAKFSALEDGSGYDEVDTVAGTRLEWRPDVDFVDIQSLIHPRFPDPKDLELIEKFSVLCMLEIQYKLTQIELAPEQPPHLKKFIGWLDISIKHAEIGEDQIFVDIIKQLTTLGRDARLAAIDEIRTESIGREVASPVELIHGLLQNFREIALGEMDPLNVYVQGNTLSEFYTLVDSKIDYTDFFRVTGHSNPNVRVLEIGAGTGVSTQSALKGLSSMYGEKMYSSYCFTDISSGFFPAAKERFAAYQGIDFKILDIGKDPIEQGFEAGSFDLIVASNVLHATPELNTTLKNVRKLLSPRGQLFLLELQPSPVKFINLIMGVLPGWWLGEADGRPDQPFVMVERWDVELKKAGFRGVEAAVYNEPRKEYQFCATIISRLPQPEKDRSVTLLCKSELSSAHDREVEETLTSQGFHVDRRTFKQELPPHQDIISIIELEDPMFHDISEDDFATYKSFLENLGSAGVLWVTKSIQMNCEDPRHALTLGLSRAMRTELSISLATLELDSLNRSSYEAIIKVFDKFHARTSTGAIDPDWEYTFHDGKINIGRFHWVSVSKELSSIVTEDGPMKLDIGRPGLLRSLGWVNYPLNKLGPDDVEIAVQCVGLNFRDVLVAMGIVDDRGTGLGLEGSGIVKRVGTDVRDLKIGDRVIMMCQNCFSTSLTTTFKRCFKIPDTLSLERAASMACVYSTVIHSFIKMAHLQKDQTVLIHSACGGVGIAAIQICQMIGAKIYVTVGNEEKVQYLITTFGIDRSCIFNSRNASFLADIMRVTSKRGVDVVLNSLSGELLHASWQCVAEHGKMVEIGKRDFIGRAQLNMDPFEANRSFIGVDIARFSPELCQPLLAETISLFEQGFIKPIEPMKVFEGAMIEDSFRYMQKGQHIGKIVVKIPSSQVPETLPVTKKIQPLMLNSQGAYLLVGGLGGLGRAISNWMVECGARNIVYLSRSAGKSEEDQQFFKELESQGCSVQAVAGDVTKLQDVQGVVANAIRPIVGVLQLSMVLRDGPFLKMSHEDWKAATEPKVLGTWNLHHALINTKLDFFVLFSSGSGLFGWTHQANYASGNTFLDAFVQYRLSQGFPASVLDVGVMSEIGYVSKTPIVEEALRASSNYSLQEKDLIDALHLVIAESSCTAKSQTPGSFVSHEQLAIGLRSTRPIGEPGNRLPWRRDARTAVYHANESSVHSTSSNSSDALDAFIASITSDRTLLNSEASLELVTREIGSCIYGFMLRPIEDLDVAQPLTDLGIDSLITVEIRNWWRRKLGVEISTLEILNGGTIASLGQLAVKRLQEKFALKVQ